MSVWPSLLHASRRDVALAAVLVATLAAVLGICGLTACEKSRFDNVAYDPPAAAPAVTFPRAGEPPFAVAQQEGKVVVLFFGYTHCPDICPTTLSDWTKAKRDLGPLAKRVRFVFVSVDPGRDTPELTQRYAASFDPDFIGLTGDSATIAAAEAAFHISSTREYVQSSHDYAMTHAAQTFIIDPHGKLRLLAEPGAPYTFLVSDIKRLLNGA